MDEIKTNFAFICDYASFSEGAKLNILGIFSNINTVKIPITQPQLYFVANLSFKQIGLYKVAVRLQSPSREDIIKPLEFDASIKSSLTNEFGILAQINAVSFSTEGKYVFRVFVDDKLVREVPLTVNKIST